MGEVIAWRVWKIKHGWLYSQVADYEWVPGEVVKAHKIGVMLGDGVHAFKRRIDAIEYGHHDCVIGQVALWGKIYEFEKGWHGEYAKIHSLDHIVNDDLFREKDQPSFLRKLLGKEKVKTRLDVLRETYGLEEH